MTAQRTYPTNAIAPWAEIVPHAQRVTVEELYAMPDDGWAYELIEGVLVRMPMSGLRATSIGSRLLIHIGMHVEENSLGIVTGEQGGYRLDPAHPRDTEVAPDIGFIRADRLPPLESPEYDKAPLLAPDLAVEVASENQHSPGMAAKAKLYLTFGAHLVWVVWPRHKRVDVWRPGDEFPTELGVNDLLDGEDVVPGFTYPIARLFS